MNEELIELARGAGMFDLIELTPNLVWLLLTKRIGNAFREISRARSHDWLMGRDNVWLGATVVNQAEAERDIPKLLQVPARVRFLSIEPMLGPIQLDRLIVDDERELDVLGGETGSTAQHLAVRPSKTGTRVDWVIVGGESGPSARPMHPNWARDIRDQCDAAGVPFLFKQWGRWKPISEMHEDEMNALYRPNRIAGEFEDQSVLNELHGRSCKVAEDAIGYGGARGFDKAFRVVKDRSGRQYCGMHMFKLGKKNAGRQLDGRTHNGFPRGAQ